MWSHKYEALLEDPPPTPQEAPPQKSSVEYKFFPTRGAKVFVLVTSACKPSRLLCIKAPAAVFSVWN